MRHPGVGSRKEGIRLGVPGFVELVGEQGIILAHGDSVALSTRINLHGHVLYSVTCGQVQPAKEGNLAIGGTFGTEQAFRLIAGHNTLGWNDLDAALGVLVGCGMVMLLVRSLGGFIMGWALGGAMGRTMGCAMAGAIMVVSVERVAGVVFSVLTLTSLGGVVTLTQSLFDGCSSSPLFAQYSEMVWTAACVALLTICQVLGMWMGIATLVAAVMAWGG